MDDKNLENINKIDLDFKGSDDDDSFKSFAKTKTIKEDVIDDGSNKGPVHTGIIIKFEDDEDDFNLNMQKHSSIEPMKELSTATKLEPTIGDAKSYNEIDTECKYGDDTEEDYTPETNNIKKKSMFDDDDEELDNKELVLEKDVRSMLPTNKVTVATIEDEYWKELSSKRAAVNDKYPEDDESASVNENKQPSLKNILRDLQKKHAKSNKKGAMGMSFHFAGNPTKEREMFNAGIGNQTGGEVFPSMSMDTAAATLIGGGEMSGADAAGTGGDIGGGVSNGGISAGGMSGGGESLKNTNYSKLLNEVFDTIGFDVVKNNDGTLIAKDQLNDNNKVSAKNISDLIYALQPFIEICILIPLATATKEKFNSYQDWCN